jgi:hypothetical protein
MVCATCEGNLPGDTVISVQMFAGDNVPQMIEITYADGERLILRAIGRWHPRDERTMRRLAQ